MKNLNIIIAATIFTLAFLFVGVTGANAQSAADGFHADVNDGVYSLAVQNGGDIYIGGPSFSTVNGTPKSRLARIRRDGTLDAAYNPAPINGGAQRMALAPDGKLIVVGSFTSIGGGPSGGIARLNFDGTNDNTFTAAASAIADLAIQPNGKVIIGGHFTTVGGTTRNRLARFNADGTLDATFNPDINNAVFGIALQPDGKILIMGQFTAVGGQARWRFARLNSDGSLDTTFQVNAPYPGASDNTYRAVVQHDGKIVVTGRFTRFGDANLTRNRLVRLNANGTIDATFAPSFTGSAAPFDGSTLDIALQPDGKLIVTGAFDAVNGAPRGGIVRLNRDGSVDTGFVTSANLPVSPVVAQPDGSIVIGGDFTMVNGFPNINRVARLYPDGRLDADTNTTVLGGPIVDMLSLPDGKTLIGGGFNSVDGGARTGIARLGWGGAADSSFANPQLNNWVYGLGVQRDGNYVVGGDFTTAGGSAHTGLARITPNGTVDQTLNPTMTNGASSTAVIGLAIQPDQKIIVGGFFTTVNGVSKSRIARLNPSGSLDTSFNASADFYVDVITLQSDGKILIGGAFEVVNGQTRAGIARLNAEGTLDTTFNPILNGVVREVLDIKVDNSGKIWVGGFFAGVNGNGKAHLVRLNSNGSVDPAYTAPTLDGGIYSISIDTNDYIYIAGSFNNIDGFARRSIGMLNASGSWNSLFADMNTNEKIMSMTIREDGKILVGGYFTSIGSQARGQFAALGRNRSPILALNVTPTNLSWYRDGIAPEVSRVVYEHSTDGVNYTALGNAVQSPFPGYSWNLAVPAGLQTGFIRARGYYDHSDRRSSYEKVVYYHKPQAPTAIPFDFDGDRKSDVGIYRQGEWWIANSGAGSVTSAAFGGPGDVLVPADYTGDGRADQAVWRPSTGEWFVQRSGIATYYSFPFGMTGDIPMPADFDGDGKTDVAVFRPSTATWYIGRSSDGQIAFAQFGANGDQPVSADYDGDGKADIAIFRPAEGSWWILRSTNNQTMSFAFGAGTDRAVPGDYTGDGKADVAVWRPSTGEWFFLRNENNQYYSFAFGVNGDIPAPADFDGDGKFDVAVFRPTQGVWYISATTAGSLIFSFGVNSDRPISNAFVR